MPEWDSNQLPRDYEPEVPTTTLSLHVILRIAPLVILKKFDFLHLSNVAKMIEKVMIYRFL